MKYEEYAKIRDSKGLKDGQISKLTGITRSTISDWKHGRSEPKIDKLEKIAEALGVSLFTLMYGEEVTPVDFVAIAKEEDGAETIEQSEKALEMARRFDALPEDKKKLVLTLLDSWDLGER